MTKKRRLTPALKAGIAAIIIVIAAAAIFHRPILTQAGNYLKLDCTSLPEKADAVIVLGSDVGGERTRKAAELYKQGIAPRLILSDGTRMSWRTMAVDEMYALAAVSGVPEEDILQEKKSRSTYENALYTKEMMLEQGFDSAVVVTADWHARRSKHVFDKVYLGTGITLNYCGAQDSSSDFDNWWTDGEKQQTVLTEWAKTIIYWVKY
ncbi:YdcF family protein [Paenibacillus alkalitolerans]|uniref:YdcF family protein n=1 Tax=Paenibacillus alkalitolerans TaxID=2799335 RepID=UPI0018F5A034|nr:YdcF family protein [Paenibacillus alkalitolerans]